MGKLKIRAICVALFLVFGHIAMIAGMVDPSILGYKGATAHQMSEGNASGHSDPIQDKQMMDDHQKMHQQMINGQMPMGGNQMPPEMKQNMPMNNQSHTH